MREKERVNETFGDSHYNDCWPPWEKFRIECDERLKNRDLEGRKSEMVSCAKTQKILPGGAKKSIVSRVR